MTPENAPAPPTDPDLAKAFAVILGIRGYAVPYLARSADFQTEYLPALLLYLVASLRYYDYNGPTSTQQAFVAAAVVAAHLQDQLDCQPPTPTLTITAPALEQHLYYLRTAVDDTLARQAARQQTFLAEMQRVADDLRHKLGLPSVPITWQAPSTPSRHTMTRGYFSGVWQAARGQTQAALTAYTLHDTYLLRLSVWQPGPDQSPTTFADLRQHFAAPAADEIPEWLGQSFFYTAQATAPHLDLAEAILTTSALRRTTLTCGDLFTTSEPEAPLLLLCATPEQDRQSADFFNNVAPQLGWYSHKARRQSDQYKNYLYFKITEMEQTLKAGLSNGNHLHERIAEGEKDFDILQAFHEQISHLERQIIRFDEQITTVKNIQGEVRINVDNYHKLIEMSDLFVETEPGKFFGPQRQRLDVLPNQIEADLDPWQSELDRAWRTLNIFRSVAERFPLTERDPIHLAQAIQTYGQTTSTDYEPTESLTILFDDIKDSTPYVDKHGDQQWQALVQRHDSLLHPIIERHQGWVIKNLGDGSLSVFPEAAQAVQAALEIQVILQQTNAQARPLDRLHVRLGLHTGPALLSPTDVLGLAVNLAARVCGQADAGEVVISEATYHQAERVTSDFASLGPRPLKGVEETVGLYRLAA